MNTDLIVISGGEPLGQQERLISLVTALTEQGKEVEIETNGTHAAHPDMVAAGARFNVSPKLSHSGDPLHRRIVPEALTSLSGLSGSTFKFVCQNSNDLDEVAELVATFNLASVWIMPIGRTPDDVTKHMNELADAVVERGWNMTTRLHTLLWGDKRGV
jgi:7-carboxy-7-deazaguanine synthase